MLHSRAMQIVEDIEVGAKRVLLRTDYDVPLKDGRVADDTRIRVSLPTINELLKRNAKSITVLCHIDRPDGKVVESLRVTPVAEHLRELLPENARVVVEENLRFNLGEEDNDIRFATELAAKGDAFINDAFAASHRKHASIVLLPKLLPSSIGMHFEAELKALDRVRNNPARPVLFVIGGAKLETKLPLIEKLADLADEILVGGKLAQEDDAISSSQILSRTNIAQLVESGRDITEESAKVFSEKISGAGTIVWNGPMGVYEKGDTSQGTRIIAQAVNAAPGYTVIGGGDTEAAATKFQAEDGIDHISMGGGAMLQYLADGTLPGLQAIEEGVR